MGGREEGRKKADEVPGALCFTLRRVILKVVMLYGAVRCVVRQWAVGSVTFVTLFTTFVTVFTSFCDPLYVICDPLYVIL